MKKSANKNSGSHKQKLPPLQLLLFHNLKDPYNQRYNNNNNINSMKAKRLLHLLAAYSLANVSYAFQGRVAPSREFTRLNYKEEYIVAHHVQSSEQQESVDAYLEFLHNRYSRMNDDTELVASNSGRHVPFKWQNPSFEDVSTLEALGLSSLASQKLLHKYHMTSKTPSIENKLISGLNKVMGALVLVRKRFIALYEAKLRALSSILLHAIRSIPHSFNKLITLGGGKKSLLLSMSVVSVFLVSVVRPVNQSLINGALQQVTRA
jgi:hypothetical protein